MVSLTKGGSRSMAHPRIAAFLSGGERSAGLIIFGKDGTLIDFDAMWGGWITDLARRLEAAAYVRVAPQLFQAVGFDPATGAIAPTGPLAVATMAELRDLGAEVMR